ncbi:MAG TPA: sugar phosphate nucleotidyltransferase [Candidatus Omnitrophota bacterium]|nr:sugar phosphate nucleotidyltransferase [Candidatus Omnitrophota bacterium]
MKGVILAGGLGSRLHPLTKVTNKHLLPVYHKPMIYYPIETLVKAGIRDILVVTGGNSSGDFLKLLGNGKQFGLKHINYTYQEGEGGIAQALGLAEHFAARDKIVVILGDNIIQDDISASVRAFEAQGAGARLLLKKVPDPERFGVATLKGPKITEIVEKPKKPKSCFAVVGIYLYDADVFDYIKTLKPSRRGELEITDVNNWYLKRGALEYDVLKGYWTDAGTFESLHRANMLVARQERYKHT